MKNDSDLDLKQAVDTGDAVPIKSCKVPQEAISEVLVDDSRQVLPVEPRPIVIKAEGLNPVVVQPPRRKDYSNQRYEKDVETIGAVTRLAKLGLSKSAVAIACRLSPIELTKWYGEEYAAGQAGMQEVIARGLMEQAVSGNPQVLMYLGKSKLGWSEANVIEHIGTINAVVSAKPLSRDEFEQKYLNPSADESDD